MKNGYGYMMMKIKSVIITLILLLPCLAYAQQFPNISYGNPIEQKWLPNFSIKDILQSRDNNIWVATNTGLYKYNINNIVHYDVTRFTADKYLNNEISCIAEDQKGNILIGTQSGLGEFSIKEGKIKLISEKDQSISQVGINDRGKILYTVGGGDIYSLVPNPLEKNYRRTLIFKASQHKKTLVKAIEEQENGNYFIAAADGLWLLKNNVLLPTAIKETVNALYKDGSTLWVGTAFKGVYKCLMTNDGLVVQGNYVPKNHLGQTESIQAIKGFNEEGIVFATTTKISLIDKQSFPSPLSIKEKAIFEKNTIRKILVDKTMNIWIGSRNGLFSVNPLTLHTQFNSFDNSIYQNVSINDLLFLNDNNILIATSTLGLKLLDAKNNKLINTPSKFKDVKLIRKTQSGTLVMVADYKFFKFNNPNDIWNVPDTGKYIPQGGVNDVVQVAPNEFWFSHWRKKIIRIKEGKSNVKLDKVYQNIIKSFSSNVHVYVLELDSKNNLWVGTRGEGLLRINLNTLSMKKFERKDGFPDQILAIEEDTKSRLWVGTRDKGLLLYEPEKDSFVTFNSSNGLPSNTICSIQENSAGEIWLATLNGVARLNEGKVLSFRTYNKESGVYNAEFSFNISEAGKDKSIYFGAENGIYKFSRLSQKAYGAPLEWTNIDLIKGKADNIEQTTSDQFSKQMLSQVDESGTIVLEHAQNSLQIGFAKLDYTLPKQNFYMYRLLGYDTAWAVLQGEKSMVRYFNLPPGDYVFQAMASETDDTWGTTPKSFAIIIKPSFWQTGYAITLYILFTLLVSFSVYKIINRWRSINKKLEEEIQSVKIYDQQMVHYADLSHEIKNRLTLIMGPLEDALKNKKVNFQVLNRIYEQGKRLKRFSDQIMNIRKSETGDFLLSVSQENITGMISKIVEDSKPLAVVKDIDISFENAEEQISGWCDAEIVEIIAMNVLNNAIKYCKPNGTVKISLEITYLNANNRPFEAIDGNYLVCVISDTGIGITEEDKPKVLEPFYRVKDRNEGNSVPGMGIGLDLVKRLIKKHYGYLNIDSVIDEYTRVVFYLPIDKTAFSINELRPDIMTQPIVIDEKNFLDMKSLILPDMTVEEQGKTPHLRKKYSLLIIDDDEEMLAYLENLFNEDFNVTLTSSGQHALDILTEAQIDIIVCDLHMPEMNGLTLCRILKADESYARIPFLLLTGRDSEEQKLVAFENGVDDFVEKPFRSELLSWRVKSLLRSNINNTKTRTVVVSDSSGIMKESNTDKFIQDVIDLIDKHIDKNYLNVEFLADEMFLSRATFYRKMEEMFGETPSTFIKKYRLKKAVVYIQSHDYSIKQISDKTGFSNPKYFSKCFKSEFGVLPSEYIGVENAKDL